MPLPSILEGTNAIQEYLNGDTFAQIGERYGVSKTSVMNFMKKHGIQSLGRRYYTSSPYSFNVHWLDELDCQEKYYFLGFFAADGNIDLSHGNYRVRIRIQTRDKYLLELFSDLLESDRPIIDSIENSRISKSGISYLSTLELGNKFFCQRLIELGFPPKKSTILRFPEWISDEWLPHFIRGYFDGDGSITVYYSENGTARATTGFDGSNYFIPALKKKLEEQGIDSIITLRSENYQCLNIDRLKDYITMLNWIYKDATIYLTRKHDKYLELINNRAEDDFGHMYKHRILREHKKDIIDRYNSGEKISAIAQSYGVSYKPIYTLIQNNSQ